MRYLFEDRKAAGRQLYKAIKKEMNRIKGKGIVLGMPRGGVIVAAEVAKGLDLPLDIIVARKIGSPMDPEVSIGAVAQDGTIFLNERHLSVIPVDRDYLVSESERQVREVRRLLKIYRREKPIPSFQGKHIILIDDGVATGFTIKAALSSLYKEKPITLTLAIPVAPKELVTELRMDVDLLISLATPSSFWTVGQYYRQLQPISDEEVIHTLEVSEERIRKN